MNNYERLFADVYFYSKEYERASAALESLKADGKEGNALLRAEREVQKLKAKLDMLCERLPEEK